MNLKAINKWANIPRATTLQDAVIRHVEHTYAKGQVEQLYAIIQNQTKLLAKIIEALNPTNEQLTDWVAEYEETLEKIP